MTGVSMGELVWLILAVLLGLGVVIAWIIKAEANRKFFRNEVGRLRARLEASEREKVMMVEEMQAFKENAGAPIGTAGPAATDPGKEAAIGKMMERASELEKENEGLKKELNEAKSSLEEVYKALCSK